MNDPCAELYDAPWGNYMLKGWHAYWLRCLHACPNWHCLKRPLLWFRKPLKATLHQPVDTQIWGLKLRLFPQGNLSEQRLLLMPQFLDPHERAYLKKRLCGAARFVDIGANAGIYTLWAASINREVRIDSLEPDPELCRRLQANLDRNQLSQVRLHRLALGSQNRSASLIRSNHNLGENRIASDRISGAFTVSVQTLQAFLSEHKIDRIDVLKIDVEGSEAEILKPFFATASARQLPRSILAELPRPPKTLQSNPLAEVLFRHKYRLICRTKMNGIFEKSDD